MMRWTYYIVPNAGRGETKIEVRFANKFVCLTTAKMTNSFLQ